MFCIVSFNYCRRLAKFTDMFISIQFKTLLSWSWSLFLDGWWYQWSTHLFLFHHFLRDFERWIIQKVLFTWNWSVTVLIFCHLLYFQEGIYGVDVVEKIFETVVSLVYGRKCDLLFMIGQPFCWKLMVSLLEVLFCWEMLSSLTLCLFVRKDCKIQYCFRF